MHALIQSTIQTLQKSKVLLSSLSDSDLVNSNVGPYYSSIGTHVRHIFDFYDCILIEGNNFDLTARKRNKTVETCCNAAGLYCDELLNKLNQLGQDELDRHVTVLDDLGLGTIEIDYTYAGLLAQANSHTIHHYAIINYILNGLQIKIKDETFGYNPTTPKPEVNHI